MTSIFVTHGKVLTRAVLRSAWVASVQSFTLAASNNRDHMPWSLYYCLFGQHIYGCCSSRTSRLWWIAHSTQRHCRGCNSKIALAWDQCGCYLHFSGCINMILIRIFSVISLFSVENSDSGR